MSNWIRKQTRELLLLQVIVFCIAWRIVTAEVCVEVGTYRKDNASNEIQICYNENGDKSWVCVCTENWNALSLNVYCRQNGYSGGNEIHEEDLNQNTTIRLSLLLLNECTGNEDSLLDCNHILESEGCQYVRVNESEECKQYKAYTECNEDNITKNQICFEKRKINLAYLIGTPTILIGGLIVILSIFCAIGSVSTFYSRRKKKLKILQSSTNELNLQDLTIVNIGIENAVRFGELEQTSTDIAQNNTGEISSEIIQNSQYSEEDRILIESGEYSVLVEGEVTDYAIYEEISQIKNEAYEGLILRYNNIFPNYETSITTSKARTSSIYLEPPSSLPQLENVFEHCFNEIKREEIEMGAEFASGQFGVVYRAVYHTEKGDIPVAIKTLKEAANSDTKVAFMREAAILAQFQHPNVLRMIGVLTTQQPYMMVTELLKTELAELLLKFKVVTNSNNTGSNHSAQKLNLHPLLLRFSQEISAGMKHLSEKHFIHRDLAARNVLVAKDLTCRIADFGMSRELNSESEYYTSSGGRIPLRWTAPEAVFFQKYSEKSDVWSFGMTLFEIWSLGEKPWGSDATNEDIVEAISTGRKLSPPTGCPRDVYSVMVDTWRMDPSSRPTFSHLLHQLTNIHPSAPPTTNPSQCLGNDPSLSKDHFPDLQQIC
ncbi:hypothetical protein LOD99_3352 [Oopsacas minuta]|uniref:Receptor protein-tyrosine kinase n=1 Tax=Oopsacas minuta TaxID=111878 RepID=A0AAV7JYF5_9METZ|nr:hypothetical protein LOD99_3352 [Oopsacas minuta]